VVFVDIGKPRRAVVRVDRFVRRKPGGFAAARDLASNAR
jgi:hypothetical protein